MASACQPAAWPDIQKRNRPFFDERPVGVECATASGLQASAVAFFLRHLWRLSVLRFPCVCEGMPDTCHEANPGMVVGRSWQKQDGLRMERLFEHIFFAPQLGLSVFDAPRITWWGCDASDRAIVCHLERLGNFVVDTDILISSCSTHNCCELPEVREEDQTLDARLGSWIWNSYHELGLRARYQAEEEGWMGNVRQLQFQYDLDDDDL